MARLTELALAVLPVALALGCGSDPSEGESSSNGGSPASAAAGGAGGAAGDAGAGGVTSAGAAGGGGEAVSVGEETDCQEAEALLTMRVCVHLVSDEQTWQELTLPGGAEARLVTKYFVPATPDARLPGLFMDAQAYTLHYDLLVEGFPDRFPGLTPPEYLDLILSPTERELFAGSILEYPTDGSDRFGFTVLDDPADPSSTVTYEQVLAVWRDLSRRFDLGELWFVPSTPNQFQAAQGWASEFPIRGITSDLDYEVYTAAVGYGTVRRYTLSQLAVASSQAAFGYQDLLVLDQAPMDIERVIAGAVTGTRQGELSHLNVRSAARGTPNCYVRGAYQQLAEWEGRLVRLECAADELLVSEATLAEAESWWAQLQPEPITVPSPDWAYSQFPDLLSVPTSTEAERRTAAARFGSKGTNLAVLYQRIAPELQLDGFLIPFLYYDEFMAAATWTVDVGNGPELLSFGATIEAWLADATFMTDAAVRRQKLEQLRTAMRGETVDPALISALSSRIEQVFGGQDVMVRFRSSSNAEDAIAFSGAGLYDSTSACLADELDGDAYGPSHCDPSQNDERTLNRALTRVWSSLFNMEAFEERQWHGIDHGQVAMGILVNTRTANEQANIVVFTGNPTAADDRYLVNGQAGELDVVSAEPGVVPEKVLLTLDAGAVTTIDRVSPSSEVARGQVVLTDTRLQELGAEMWTVQQVFPVDEPTPPGYDLLLDSEWKIRSDGQLIIKQVRPFLRKQ